MKTRLVKVLAQAGVGARRKCDMLVLQGKVCVNGQTVKTPQTMVDMHKDAVTVEGKPIEKERNQYFIFHKPRGLECTHKKAPGKKIIYDMFADIGARLFSVGRLDRDTTGLLILTNDGEFANQVIHPSAGLSKEYLVKTNKEITHEHLVTIGQGLEIDGTHVRPVKVKKVRRNTFKIAVREGKKHEVRKLTAYAGLKVLELKRLRIGNLQLGTLPEGACREMTAKERQLTLLR